MTETERQTDREAHGQQTDSPIDRNRDKAIRGEKEKVTEKDTDQETILAIKVFYRK